MLIIFHILDYLIDAYYYSNNGFNQGARLEDLRCEAEREKVRDAARREPST